MSQSFTNGTTTVQPLIVDGWSTDRVVTHSFQTVIGGAVAAWVSPAAPRSGTLSAIFTSLADAQTLESMLAGVLPITFRDSDVPAVGLVFLAADRITLTCGADQIVLDDGSFVYPWSVQFGFQEVTP